MTLKLKGASSPSSTTPFSWDDLRSPSPATSTTSTEHPSHSATVWLPARDMKIYSAHPLTSTSDIGVVRCKECSKPILKSVAVEHAAHCLQIRNIAASSKKRKASPVSGSVPGGTSGEPPSKKAKTTPLPKITKGRSKLPVDYDKQCGVINDKGLPCSRSLTCKSHSMGAKRAVEGRSEPYDVLLLAWQRLHNPNFVEPVKRETKKEKKEKKEREKAERKKAIEEAAVKLGLDPASAAGKKAGAAATGNTITNSKHSSSKTSKRAAAAAAAAAALSANTLDDIDENLDDIDSEQEVEELVSAVRTARNSGLIAQPLAVPSDVSSWFVERRERMRSSHVLISAALNPTPKSQHNRWGYA